MDGEGGESMRVDSEKRWKGAMEAQTVGDGINQVEGFGTLKAECITPCIMFGEL